MRYRGYYWDSEFSLYYLQSRYYDPALGRFISADAISYLNPEDVIGFNLYSYCGNNPVMYNDPEGTAWWQWLVGGLVIASLAIATIATGGAAGGVAGFIVAGALKGAVIGAVSSAAIGGTISGIQSAVEGNGFWKGFENGAATGFMSGAIIGGVTGAINSTAQVFNAAKAWDPGTFKSGFQSMKYHYAKHGADFKNIVDYTQSALNFAERNASVLKYTYNWNYGNASWNFNYLYGNGGMFTTLGQIITFW